MKLSENFASNLVAKGVNKVVASVQDYTILDGKSAKVLVRLLNTRVKQPNYNEVVHAAIDNLIPGLNVVPGSTRFEHSDNNSTSVSAFYVPTNETRKYETAANMRVLATNVYMDADDESVWNLVESANGDRILTRKSLADIGPLVKKSAGEIKYGNEQLSQVVASVNNYVSYVKEGAVKIGIVLARTDDDYQVFDGENPESVDSDEMLDAYDVPNDEVAALTDPQQLLDYYKRLYGEKFPDYYNQIADQIKNQSI
jgi:murein DD-endopeptidase MepM/ murein hydrolase activator NlpD